jgi:hypothetical protein
MALPRCLQRAFDLGVQQGSTGGVLGGSCSNQHVDIENWDLQGEAVVPQLRRDDNENDRGSVPKLITTRCQMQGLRADFYPECQCE